MATVSLSDNVCEAMVRWEPAEFWDQSLNFIELEFDGLAIFP